MDWFYSTTHVRGNNLRDQGLTLDVPAHRPSCLLRAIRGHFPSTIRTLAFDRTNSANGAIDG